MSANNAIYINTKTSEAFYQGCVDNGMDGAELIAKGKNLEDVVNKAREWLKGMEGEFGYFILEYGFNFY